MGQEYRHEFTEELEAVARGVRRLQDIRDPALRDAVGAALGLPPERPGLDPARRASLRRELLRSAPLAPRLSDRLLGAFRLLAFPAPYAVRALAVGTLCVALLAGTTVASADSLPDEPLYGVKLAAEQLRLALAVAPEDRATVELSLAEHRLAEAERLAADGHASGVIVATSAYAAHLASAAAELAVVDELAPRAIALVRQLEARITEQRQRAGEAAQRLIADPRTALAGVVISTIATTPQATGGSAATRIADSASAVSARLSAVAEDRASGGRPLTKALDAMLGRPSTTGPQDDDAEEDEDAPAPEERRPLFVVPPTIPSPSPHALPTPADRTSAPVRTAPGATPARTTTASTTAPARAAAASAPAATAPSTVRPSLTPRPTPTRRASPTPARTVDASARIAAEKAKESAAKARAAAEKAKQAAKRTPSPRPVPPTRTPAR